MFTKGFEKVAKKKPKAPAKPKPNPLDWDRTLPEGAVEDTVSHRDTHMPM